MSNPYSQPSDMEGTSGRLPTDDRIDSWTKRCCIDKEGCEPILLEPTASEVTTRKDLTQWMRTVTRYADRSRRDDAPQRVARIFLAFNWALAAAGVVQDIKDTCALRFRYASGDYAVRLSSWAEGAKDSDLHRLIFSVRGDSERLDRRSSHCRQAADVSWLNRVQKGMTLEDSRRAESCGARGGDEAGANVGDPWDLMCIPPHNPATGRQVDAATAKNPSASILSALVDVQQAENVALRFSERISRSYARLGDAYIAFGQASFPSCPHPSSPKFHKLVFGLVVTVLQAQPQGLYISEAALKKRLERARKFWIVVDMLGEGALAVVEEVNVSALDRTSFDKLVRLSELLREQTAHAPGHSGMED